jgi:hypothetical protein
VVDVRRASRLTLLIATSTTLPERELFYLNSRFEGDILFPLLTETSITPPGWDCELEW